MGAIDTMLGAVVTVFALGRPVGGETASSDLRVPLDKWRILRRTRRTRVQLADLTDDQLRDIGISREDALREVKRSVLLVWDGVDISR
jgi:uncharacterized protein YjiS (DUF1127 family)